MSRLHLGWTNPASPSLPRGSLVSAEWPFRGSYLGLITRLTRSGGLVVKLIFHKKTLIVPHAVLEAPAGSPAAQRALHAMQLHRANPTLSLLTPTKELRHA
jgi:hypothetical protein